MKTTLRVSIATSAVLFCLHPAFAREFKPYINVFGGGSYLTANPNSVGLTNYELLMDSPGLTLGAAVGFDLGNHLRTELEFSHVSLTSNKYNYSDPMNSGLKTGNSAANATYLLGDLWYDVDTGSRFTPYLGGGVGLGWAHVNSDAVGLDFAQTPAPNLAFQLGAGVRLELSDHVEIDAGYRFKDIVGINYVSNFGLTKMTDTNLASHTVQIGLTYNF